MTRRQLLDAGLAPSHVRSWVDRGRLIKRHRGVYTLGDALLSREGRWLAAVFACGPRAVLSHRAAGALWGLLSSPGPRIEVTVPLDGSRRPAETILTRESGIVFPRFATKRAGIPVTTVAWTLLDLASVLRAAALRRAVEQAEQLDLFDLREVAAALAADPGRPGSPPLLALLDDLKDHGVPRTRSDVEAALLQLCIDHELARPQVNRYDNEREVDFRWPEHRLIVEIDGWQFHRSRQAFVADRARDRAALATGWRVARFPATEVMRDPMGVVAELLALLRACQP